MAHPSLRPTLRAAYWNGTYLTGKVEDIDWGMTPDLPSHGYPHICTFEALNTTVTNYFHLGVRWTSYYDKSKFLGPGETADPVQRIQQQLVPFLVNTKLIGALGRYPSGPTLIVAHSLLWDLRGLAFGAVAKVQRVQLHIPSWMRKTRDDFLFVLASTFPSAEIAWRTVPYAHVNTRFGMGQMAVMNGAGEEVARGIGMEVLDWAQPLIGRWDLLRKDGFHQGDRGLDVLWRLILGKIGRMKKEKDIS
ncbi:hypothetical protein HDV00_003074 [Rhizophlyctis rosea]|nr:hypothetical protein HDV00_003074 [Rhizophlyctis rosea]